MGDVVNINDALNKNKKDSDSKILRQQASDFIGQNIYLQRCIKAIGEIPIYNVDENNKIVENTCDYNKVIEEFRKEEQKIRTVNTDNIDEYVNFYYNWFMTGYSTFGLAFVEKMMKMSPQREQFVIGTIYILLGLDMSYNIMNEQEVELRAYKSLKLNKTQKAALDKELQKTPEEFLQDLVKESEKLEKK